MIRDTYILNRLRALPQDKQTDTLLSALNYMKEDPARSPEDCIGLAMNIPIFPKVKSACIVDGYELALRFNNGEERLLDFRQLLDPERELEKQLLDDEGPFRRFKVADGTLFWPAVGREGKDFEGRTRFFAFDIDPGLLFEHSVAPTEGG